MKSPNNLSLKGSSQRAIGVARRSVKHVLQRSGSIALARSRRPNPFRLTVLCYHSVSESADYCGRDISVTPKAFAAQMRYLARHYNVLGLEDAVARLRAEEPLPPRSVCITFDDGYRDNFENALPILRANGLHATFFIATDPVLNSVPFWVGRLHQIIVNADNPTRLAERFGVATTDAGAQGYAARRKIIDAVSLVINAEGLERRRAILDEVETLIGPLHSTPTTKQRMMMDVHELRALIREGMTIGAHSMTHPILTKLTDNEAVQEIAGSKAALEAALNTSIGHFAYPNGPCDGTNFDARIKGLVAQVGLLSACTSVRGMVSTDSDCHALPRQGINARLDSAAFAFKLEEDRFDFLTGLANRVRR